LFKVSETQIQVKILKANVNKHSNCAVQKKISCPNLK